jgi:hypothetical protein
VYEGGGLNIDEAKEWLKGNRSTVNSIPQHPLETWDVRIQAADASMIQQAYYILKAHKEGLLKENAEINGLREINKGLLKALERISMSQKYKCVDCLYIDIANEAIGKAGA